MLSAKPWRAEAVIMFCGAQLFCYSFGLMLIGLFAHAGLAAFKPPDGFGAVLVGSLCFQGVTWALIPVFLRLHQMNWRDAFGFGPRLPRALLAAVLVIIVILPVVLILENASVFALEKFGWHVEEQMPVQLVLDTKSLWGRIYLGVFAIVLAPVAEEFIFRGMLFPFVKQRGFPKFAWFGVSFLFALIHLDVAKFIPLFALALALTWLYEYTDSLIAPIAGHSLFNATNFALLLWQTRPIHG
jgi:membrane protease YdiL (CAAX protease family)